MIFHLLEWAARRARRAGFGMPSRLGFALLFGLLMTGGCARYEYRVAQPAQFAQTITRQETRIDIPPVGYRLREQRKQLVFSIVNPTDQTLTLVGPKSFVVDPRGETHPIHGGPIAPRSFVGMIFPPQAPTYTATPAFSFGFGSSWGYPLYGGQFGMGFGGPFDPFYGYGPYDISPVNLPHYWEWKTGEVRLHLTYNDGSTNAAQHDFVFERRRVK